MSDYMQMTLEQLQKEHAELLQFNETLDNKYKHHAARAEKYRRKCESIASLFVVPSENHQMTLKAIKTILERVGAE
jgi:D-mannonate dehydratase